MSPCRIEGCSNQAQKGGVCVRHGAIRPRCKIEGCSNQAKKQGVCVRHGASFKKCSSGGCSNRAVKGGVCVRHGATTPRCKIVGCSNNARKRGVCARHGASMSKCQVGGCSNIAKKRGVCIRHGASVKQCSIGGCYNNAQKGGVCKRHGAGSSKKRKSPDPEPETPSFCLPVGMGADRLNVFRGGGTNDTTPKVGDGNDVSPGQSSPHRSKRRRRNNGEDSDQQQNVAQDSSQQQNNNQQQNNSRLQMPSMESPAPSQSALQMNRGQNRSVSTGSDVWLSRTQDENDIGEVDRFSFDCGGTVTAQGSGVYWLKEDREGQPLEYAIVGSITNGSYADEHTNLQVGKTLIFICTCQ